MNVARDTLRDLSAWAYGVVKAADLHRVDTADRAGEGLGGRPENVDVGVVYGRGKVRGARDDVYLSILVGVGAEGLGDLRPNGTRGPDAGDFHKEVGAQGEAEFYVRHGDLRLNAAVAHRPDVGDRRAHRVGGLLCGARAAVVVDVAANQYRFDLRSVFLRPFYGESHLVI